MTYDLMYDSPYAFTLATCAPNTHPVLRVGGAPRLPEPLNWPRDNADRPMHFFGAFDFARIPKSFEVNPVSPVPDVPGNGTGLIFLNMLAQSDDEFDATILYCETQDRVELDGRLPANLEPMTTSQYVDETKLSSCGRMFTRSDHALTATEDRVRREPPLALSFRSLDSIFDALIDDSTRPLDQSQSFQIASEIVTGFYEVTRNELHNWHSQNVDARTVEKLEGRLAKQKAKIDGISIDETAPFLDRLRYGNGKLPQPTEILDDLFISWMRYVRVNCEGRNTSKKLTDAEMAWFRAACDRIVRLENDTSPPMLECLGRMRNHDVTREEVASDLHNHFTERLTQKAQYAATLGRPPVVFPKFKMFGKSDREATSAFDEYKSEYGDGKHILLFQFGDAFGPCYLLVDCLLQVWIRPEDLAQGKFDRIAVEGSI